MNQDNRAKTATTPGTATFIRSNYPPVDLFRITPGIPCDYALEQAAAILGCVHKLIHTGVMDEDNDVVMAAYYLSGLAKAIINDVELGVRKSNVAAVRS